MICTAVIDGDYRYELRRVWARQHSSGLLTWVMLNPSVADATQDDPTIRRCIAFAKRWDFGGIRVVNLYAYRATKPIELQDPEDPVGPRNDDFIQSTSGTVVCAWGAYGMAPARARVVLPMLLPTCRIWALGTTGSGAPKHPLYMAADSCAIGYPVEPSEMADRSGGAS